MNPDKAREYLEEYFKNNGCKLPVTDEIVMRLNTPFVIADITFLGLICIAYDLLPKPKNEEQ